jgi:hypothetical protein
MTFSSVSKCIKISNLKDGLDNAKNFGTCLEVRSSRAVPPSCPLNRSFIHWEFPIEKYATCNRV